MFSHRTGRRATGVGAPRESDAIVTLPVTRSHRTVARSRADGGAARPSGQSGGRRTLGW
jgi:hypothetical protein